MISSMKPTLLAPLLPWHRHDKFLIRFHITLTIQEFGIFYFTNVKKTLNGVVTIDKNIFRIEIFVLLSNYFS